MRSAILLVLLCSSCTLVEGPLYAPLDPDSTERVRFTVPRGATASSLGPALAEAGVVASADRWKAYLKLSGEGSCLKAGDFSLSASMSLPQIMDVLCGVPLPDDVPFTVVEGWRIRDIDAALVEAGLVQPGAYQAVAEHFQSLSLPFTVEGATLEGYLFPDTYQVSPSRFKVEAFVERQVQTFWERFGSAHADGYDGHDLGEVVIMASLLEREEPNPANRPTTAGILYKRLAGGWALGVDATSRYTLADWNDKSAFLKQLKDPDDPYNTRLRQGLPPTAIGNPGLGSLAAAVEPVASEYWYYLHDGNGQVHWARNGREHEQNRARYNVY
ncbi:MAG: endolytic transglycosylase MltG [Pseudomonadota bacterium]